MLSDTRLSRVAAIFESAANMTVSTGMPSKMSMLVMTASPAGTGIYKPGRQTAWYPRITFVFDYTAVLIVTGHNGIWSVVESCFAARGFSELSYISDEYYGQIARNPVYTFCSIPTVPLQL